MVIVVQRHVLICFKTCVSCVTHVSVFPVLPMHGGLQCRQGGQKEQQRICWIETFRLNTSVNFRLFHIGVEISREKLYSAQTDPLLQLNSD